MQELPYLAPLIAFVTDNKVELAASVFGVIGAFAFIARFTPNKVDDALAAKLKSGMQFILNSVNALGMNSGKAKNDPRA